MRLGARRRQPEVETWRTKDRKGNAFLKIEASAAMMSSEL
jgi:hypothetical protein